MATQYGLGTMDVIKLIMQSQAHRQQQQEQMEQQELLSGLPQHMQIAAQHGWKPQEVQQAMFFDQMFGQGGQQQAPPVDPATVAPWEPPPGPMQLDFPPEFLQDVGVVEAQGLADEIARQQIGADGMNIHPLLRQAGVTQESLALALATGDMRQLGMVPDALAQQAPVMLSGVGIIPRTKRGFGEFMPTPHVTQVPYTDPVTGATSTRFVSTLGGMPSDAGVSIQTQAPALDPGKASQQVLIEDAGAMVDALEAMLFKPDGTIDRKMLAMRDVPGQPGKATTFSSQWNQMLQTLARSSGMSTKELEQTFGISSLPWADSEESARDKFDRLRGLIAETAARQGLSTGGRGGGRPAPKPKAAEVQADEVYEWDSTGTRLVPVAR
jgi:hypothetical protein